MEIILDFPDGTSEFFDIEAENEEDIIPGLQNKIARIYKKGSYIINKVDDKYVLEIKPKILADICYNNYSGNYNLFAKNHLNEFMVKFPCKRNYHFFLKNLLYINDLETYEYLIKINYLNNEHLRNFIKFLLKANTGIDNNKFFISVLDKILSINEDYKHWALTLCTYGCCDQAIKHVLSLGAKHKKVFDEELPLNLEEKVKRKKETGLYKVIYFSKSEDLHNIYGRKLLVDYLSSEYLNLYSDRLTRLIFFGKTKGNQFNIMQEKMKLKNTHSFVWYTQPDDIFLIKFFYRTLIEHLPIFGYDLNHLDENGQSLFDRHADNHNSRVFSYLLKS